MSKKVELAVTAHYSAEKSVLDLHDGTGYLVNVHTKFIGETFDIGHQQEVHGEIELGTLEFTLIRVSAAVEDRIPFTEVFDQTQEIWSLAEAIYSGNGYEDYQPVLAKTFPDSNSYADLLYFTHIGLRPHARGVRLGLAIVYKAIQDWASGCSLVVLDPYPLQDRQIVPEGGEWPELELTRFTDSFGDARQRLIDYYSQLGFKPVGESPYIYYDPAVQQPRAAHLRFPETIFVELGLFEE